MLRSAQEQLLRVTDVTPARSCFRRAYAAGSSPTREPAPMSSTSPSVDLAPLLREAASRPARRFVGLALGALADGGEATVGFGRIGPDGPAPGARTSFQIGSVTKLFTALLLADAVHRGEVALDQPLDTLIPAAAHPDGRPIALVDLATHTSGLPRLPRGLIRQALRHRDDPYVAFTTDQLVEALSIQPRRPPGGRSRYSNLGAGVLGEALARATGLPYGELVHQRVVSPLGLRDTRVEPDGSEASVAVGHTRRGKPVGDWHLPALAGAGALRSSAADLLRFLRAHLDPDSTPLAVPVREVLEPRARISRPLAIGLGWHILDRPSGSRWWWHNGGTGGFMSFVGIDPARGAGVVVLANSARSPDRIGHVLLDALGHASAGR